MSGSAFSAAVETGEVKDFFGRIVRFGVSFSDNFDEGRLGVGGRARLFVVVAAVEVVESGVALARGDLKGVLNGERKGLERV